MDDSHWVDSASEGSVLLGALHATLTVTVLDRQKAGGVCVLLLFASLSGTVAPTLCEGAPSPLQWPECKRLLAWADLSHTQLAVQAAHTTQQQFGPACQEAGRRGYAPCCKSRLIDGHGLLMWKQTLSYVKSRCLPAQLICVHNLVTLIHWSSTDGAEQHIFLPALPSTKDLSTAAETS